MYTTQFRSRDQSYGRLHFLELRWEHMLRYLLTFSFTHMITYFNVENVIKSGHSRLSRSCNSCNRHVDDLILFTSKKFLRYLNKIYPSQLMVERNNKSYQLAIYLDLAFKMDMVGKLSTRLYDKCDDFEFHVVNFPFLFSNIPSSPSYGVYISQLIKYA